MSFFPSAVVFVSDIFFRPRIVFQSVYNEATSRQPPTAIFETRVLISSCSCLPVTWRYACGRKRPMGDL